MSGENEGKGIDNKVQTELQDLNRERMIMAACEGARSMLAFLNKQTNILERERHSAMWLWWKWLNESPDEKE
jgi:hypothetical protein